MNCPECARLDAERARLESAATVASARLDDQLSTANVRQYLRLRTAAHEAKLELSMAEIELTRHLQKHQTSIQDAPLAVVARNTAE